MQAGTLTRYRLKIFTTDVPQCMTSASGFAILHGPEESSQRIQLPRQDRMSFQPGTDDMWSSAEMQDVGDLQSLTLGLHKPVRFICDCIGCVSAGREDEVKTGAPTVGLGSVFLTVTK